MQRKIQLTLAIFLCCASMAWAQQDSIYSLKECIETGIMNNLVLQSKGQEIQKSKFEITEYRTRLFPKIQAFGNFTNYIDKPTSVSLSSQVGSSPSANQPYMQSQTMRYNTSGGIQFSLPIYNQTLYTGIGIAKRMQDIQKMNYEKAKEDLTVEISQIYYLAQSTLEGMRLAQDNIQRLSELREITQAAYDNGVAMEVDVQRVDINLENAKVQYDNSISMYQQQLNMLRYVMGVNPDISFSVERFNMNFKEKNTVMGGLSNDLYEIKILQAKQDVLKRQGQVIKQGYIPSLSFVSQLGYTKYANHFNRIFHSTDTPKWYNSFYWGIALNIPIFDGFEKQAKLRKNKVEAYQNKLLLQDTHENLQTQYDNACNDYLNNERNFIKQRDNYLLAEKVYTVTFEKYREGIASMTELLQDEISMSSAQNNYVNAHYSYKVSELSLLKLGHKLDSLTE